MKARGWTNILGGLLVVALATASRPAFACEPVSTAVHPELTHAVLAHATVTHSSPTHALPPTIALASHHSSGHAHHRHHSIHHASLNRDLSAGGPASLPGHPAGLPHSNHAAAAHHAPTLVVRQGKGSSRSASFLAERFAWGVDRLSFTLAVVERGIPKNQTFDVNAGRGPPRAGPYGDSGSYSASLALPASTNEIPPHPANSLTVSSARHSLGAPYTAAAFAFRDPACRAASLGERCRMNRSRLTPSPAIVAPEAWRVA
jgi:hypothetical protein